MKSMLRVIMLSALIPGVMACENAPDPSALPAPVAAAVPATKLIEPPSGLAAVAFLAQTAAFASRLGDATIIPASTGFLKDSASYYKAVELGGPLLRQVLSMKTAWVANKGYRYILFPDIAPPDEVPPDPDAPVVESPPPAPDPLPPVLVLFFIDGVFRIDLAGSYRYKPDSAPDPDPRNHFPTLAESLVGISGEGDLTAVFNFGPGSEIRCRLLKDDAPLTVAAFVALARGLRSIRTEQKVDGSDEIIVDWVKKPWYDGLAGRPGFSRRILEIGTGLNPGFVVPDEFTANRRHDGPALLTTVPGSPERWSGAIGITAAQVSALDDTGTVFGVCDQKAVDRMVRASSLRKGNPAIPRLQTVRITLEN